MDPTNKKNKNVVIVSVLAIVVAGASVGYLLMQSLGKVSTEDAYIEGRVHTIAAKIPGTVERVTVKDNQSVRNAELMVTIDAKDFELKAVQAQAALEAQRARLLDAEAGINTAQANLEVQRVMLEQSLRDKTRADALFNEKVISQEKQEKALTAYNLAVAQAKAAAEQVVKAKAVFTLEESVIKQKESELEIATRNVGYTKILSPADGYVTKKSVEEGNQIQAGQPLMAVVALEDIWIIANFKETQLRSVKPGQRVLIKIDTYAGKVFEGKVESIMAGTGAAFSLFPPENALGNYVKVVQRIPVKIVFDKTTDARHILRIGMSCVPTILTHDE